VSAATLGLYCLCHGSWPCFAMEAPSLLHASLCWALPRQQAEHVGWNRRLGEPFCYLAYLRDTLLILCTRAPAARLLAWQLGGADGARIAAGTSSRGKRAWGEGACAAGCQRLQGGMEKSRQEVVGGGAGFTWCGALSCPRLCSLLRERQQDGGPQYCPV